jgi:transcriptional regulator with PAS, ATPase and Fis domain
VEINCAAMPESLLESELFGHERGAFTGAERERRGRFEMADGGTLFLDEIADMPLSMQAKILRVIQDKIFTRVGGEREIRSDFRLVAACNRDLLGEVKVGNFREDLFYRVAVVPVALPPLRERREDIRLLAQTFLARMGPGRKFTAAALGSLDGYNWPGNVRELENAIEYALAMCDGDTIDQDDLPISIGRSGQAEALREQWRQGERSFEETVTRFETNILREALESHRWNQTQTANALGITRRVLKLKMDKLGIESQDSTDGD